MAQKQNIQNREGTTQWSGVITCILPVTYKKM
jgi:hypothetical protein